MKLLYKPSQVACNLQAKRREMANLDLDKTNKLKYSYKSGFGCWKLRFLQLEEVDAKYFQKRKQQSKQIINRRFSVSFLTDEYQDLTTCSKNFVTRNKGHAGN